MGQHGGSAIFDWDMHKNKVMGFAKKRSGKAFGYAKNKGSNIGNKLTRRLVKVGEKIGVTAMGSKRRRGKKRKKQTGGGGRIVKRKQTNSLPTVYMYHQ